MTDDEKEEPIKIGVDTLNLVLSSLNPYKIKISSLLEGHYKNEWPLPELDLIVLMETKLSILIILTLLEEKLLIASENKTDFVILEADEIFLISSLSKTVMTMVSEPMNMGLVFLEH